MVGKNEWRDATDTSNLEPGERVIICIEGFFVGEGWIGKNGKWYRNGLETEKYYGGKVTEWMPMPKPNEAKKGRTQKQDGRK